MKEKQVNKKQKITENRRNREIKKENPKEQAINTQK